MGQISGGELLVRTLKQAGVDRLFGLHGAHVDPIFQACLDTGTRLGAARYDQVAVGFGCRSAHITRIDQLAPAIRDAFASGRPACLNVEIDLAPIPPELHLLMKR